MEINSLKFGKIKVDKEKIITFKDPIIGFDQISKYVLFDARKDSPLKWLHSVNEPSPCFLITNPHIFMSDYDVVVSRQDMSRVECEKQDELGVIVLVTIHEAARKITANLRGPIIINFKGRLAKQIVLQDDKYSTCHPLCLMPAVPRKENPEKSAHISR